jgi:electron transfer flavoprotein alpha subunit
MIYATRQLCPAIGYGSPDDCQGCRSGIKAISINDAEQAGELSKRADTYKIDNAAIQVGDTAAVAAALKQTAPQLGANIVLLSSNRRGKELSGRLAQSLGAGC